MSGIAAASGKVIGGLGQARRHLAAWYQRSYTTILIFLLVFAVCATYMAPRIIVEIPAGSGGVLWRRFAGGTVFGPALGEGYQITWPWDKVFVYDLRLHQLTLNLETLCADGLNINVEVSIRYRLSSDHLAYLHAGVGADYQAKVIVPQISAVIRSQFGLYPAEAVVGPARQLIQGNIFRAATDRGKAAEIGALDPATGFTSRATPSPEASQEPETARHRGFVNTSVNTINQPMILIQDLLIARIVLPDRLRAAIEAKLEQKQHSDEYQYRLTAERYESDRKALEAEGIRRFQDTVSRSLTPGYLTWRGIQATETLAKSPNSKIVVIGGSNGLPLILNTGETGATPAPPAPKPVQPSETVPVTDGQAAPARY